MPGSEPSHSPSPPPSAAPGHPARSSTPSRTPHVRRRTASGPSARRPAGPSPAHKMKEHGYFSQRLLALGLRGLELKGYSIGDAQARYLRLECPGECMWREYRRRQVPHTSFLIMGVPVSCRQQQPMRASWPSSCTFPFPSTSSACPAARRQPTAFPCAELTPV